MEPVDTKVIIRTEIAQINQRMEKKWLHGTGKDAVFQASYLGWFLHLIGSHEALYIGDGAPADWKAGDKLIITIQKDRTCLNCPNINPTSTPNSLSKATVEVVKVEP